MNSSIINHNFSKAILVGIIYFLIVFVGIPVAIHFLSKRCNKQYEDFEVYTEETEKVYIPIHKLFIKLLINPKELIRKGQITAYNQDDFEVWFYSSSILIGLIVTMLIYGVSRVMAGIIAIPIGAAIGRWFFVGIQTIGFRYIARVKLSYEEGQKVFGPIYWIQYIITIILEYVQSLIPEKWTYVSIIGNIKISIFQIIIFIWFTVICFLLLKYRYHLTRKQSVMKVILISLSYIGVGIILCSILILIAILTR